MREEAEDSYPIVEADDNDSLSGELSTVIQGIGGRAAYERAPVNEYHDWPVRASVVSGGPDADSQAVLAGLLACGDHVGRLHAIGAKASCVPHARPRKRRLRWAPAQRANRRCGVGDTLEGQDLAASIAVCG